MSGGHFDYQEFRLLEIADKIKSDLEVARYNETQPKKEHEYQFTLRPETAAIMQDVVNGLRACHAVVKQYDLMYSCDTDEEFFLSQMQAAVDQNMPCMENEKLP